MEVREIVKLDFILEKKHINKEQINFLFIYFIPYRMKMNIDIKFKTY